MADNSLRTPGSGESVASDEVTYSGDTAKIQVSRFVHVSGSEGSKTVTEIVGTAGSPAAGMVTVQEQNVSTHHIITAASDNAANIKASAGTLKSVHVFNVADYPIYVKFHNIAGSPTVGAGVVFTVGVQAGTRADVVLPGNGKAFTTGIAVSVITDMADAGTTAVAAGDAAIEVCYV